MPTYRVWVQATASRGIDVEADNREQAIERVFDSPEMPHSLCHQCAGEMDLGDFDVADDADAVTELDGNGQPIEVAP
jgi:hypothetical protein